MHKAEVFYSSKEPTQTVMLQLKIKTGGDPIKNLSELEQNIANIFQQAMECGEPICPQEESSYAVTVEVKEET